MSNNAQKLHDQRLKRVFDAVALKEPDRVPIAPVIQAFPLYNYGLTVADAMYDYKKMEVVLDKFYTDYQPDLAWDPVFFYPAKMFEILDIQWFRWPGGKFGMDPNTMYQYIEKENMFPEEYDELIHDPTHFMMSKFLPRSYGSLKGLEKIRLRGSLWMNIFDAVLPFSFPDVQNSLKALMEAGEEVNKWYQFIDYYDRKLNKMGFPVAWGSFGFAPFDMLGDTLRGTVPILEDLYDYPEKILEVVDKFTTIAIESAVASCKATGRPFVWIWLHKGVDQFMSVEQYKKFYWPSLQKYLIGLVDAGLTPIAYCEGSYNNRLDILRDVPKGKIIYNFETVDMFNAKKVLGDAACIAGNVPNSMLAFGTPQEVEEYCKKLIDVCGQGGGFIMDSSALIDNAKPENLDAMFKVTQTYGVYK